MPNLTQHFSTPIGTFLLLSLAALLEVIGDSFFQSALHRSAGGSRIFFLALGAAVLVGYGLVVNLSGWDFGRLLGVYVVFFFLATLLVARVRFHQSPTVPQIIGGIFIVTGGLLISFWKV